MEQVSTGAMSLGLCHVPVNQSKLYLQLICYEPALQMRVTLMDEIGRESFIMQFADSPARLAWVEACLSEPNTVRALVDAADESAYSLRQWVDALIVIGQWLDARGLRASFDDQLGYIHCACESAGAGTVLIPLPSLVSEMLDDYGFDLAEPS